MSNVKYFTSETLFNVDGSRAIALMFNTLTKLNLMSIHEKYRNTVEPDVYGREYKYRIVLEIPC